MTTHTHLDITNKRHLAIQTYRMADVIFENDNELGFITNTCINTVTLNETTMNKPMVYAVVFDDCLPHGDAYATLDDANKAITDALHSVKNWTTVEIVKLMNINYQHRLIQLLSKNEWKIQERMTNVTQYWNIPLDQITREYPETSDNDIESYYDDCQNTYVLVNNQDDYLVTGDMDDIREYIQTNG